MASVTKHVDYNTIFDSSTSFLKNTTFDSSIYINVASPASSNDNPYAVITLGTGLSQLITYRQLGNMAWEASTNYASLNYVNTYNAIQDASLGIALAGTTEAWNGLTKTDGSIGLGGTLALDVSIVTSASNTISIYGLQTSVSGTPLALVQDSSNGALKVRSLGTMAWETTTTYATVANVNAYNNIQDASIVTIISSLSNYVAKTGDTMTGQLIITGGGLAVGTIGSPVDVSIYNNLYVHNNLTMGGNLTIDGSIFVRSVESIDVSSGFIFLNTGQTSNPGASMQSGIIIDRGDTLNPYVFLYDESTESFRIGLAPRIAGPSFDDASTQVVATRQDTPIATGVAYWNNTLNIIDTDASMIFANGRLSIGYLSVLDGSIIFANLANDGNESTGLLINSSNQVVTREFGTGAFATISDYATVTSVNSYNSIQDVSITQNRTSINILDSSVASYNISITDLSTNKLDSLAATTGVAGHDVYSGESNNIAYIKKLVAGSGALITSDSSVVTISVSGTATAVNKFSTTLDGTSGTSLVITQASHGLPAPGPYSISVYEYDGVAINYVNPGISYNSSGDVTIRWTSGSLSADCSVFIAG